MLRGQHNPTFNTVYRAAYSRKRQFLWVFRFCGKLYFEYLECARPRALRTPEKCKKRHIEEHGVAQHKKSNLFHYTQNRVHQTSKKIVFLPCCEPVLFCAFGAQNRVQFAWAKIDKLNIRNLKFKFKPRTVATLKRDVLPLLPLSCVWSSEQSPPPLKHNNFNNIFHFCYFKLFFSNPIPSTKFSRQYKEPQEIYNNNNLSFLASCPRTPIFLSPNPFTLRSCMFQTKVVKEDQDPHMYFPSLPRASMCVKLHDVVGQGTNVIPQQKSPPHTYSLLVPRFQPPKKFSSANKTNHKQSTI